MQGSAHAQALHAQYPPIDLHADTLMWARWLGYDLHARHEPPLPRAAIGGHVDVPRLREGGYGAQFFGLVSLPIPPLAATTRAVTEQIDILDQALARWPNDLRLARSAADLETIRRDGAIGALLGVEGAHALEGDLDRVDTLAERGVRYLGLLHFSANEAGFPAKGYRRRDSEGLTPWGFDLVRRCEAAGVLVDLAHINRRGFLDACSIAQKPPIISHTGVIGAFDHWRNVDDAQLRAVADKGGVVGVIFYPRYLGGDGLDPIVKHMLHILNVVGEDTPALGSDWDGFIVPTRELADPRGLPLLTDALLRAGLSERVIGKILRNNVLRVLAS
ncbi:MAG: dipeptidase [Polyangiaceae bacterium]|nr:dipeptidase [Polyangiaceae bacterium]